MMRLFLEGIPSDPVTLLLLDTLAQVTAITLLALLVARTVARRSPAARHGIALCALFCVLSSPAIAGGVERVGRPEVGTLSAFVPGALSLHPVTAALLVVWAAGVVWQVVRFAAGCAWLVRLRHSVSLLCLEERASVVEDVHRAIGRCRFPALGESPLVRGPVVLGPFRPMIVLPSGMNETLDDAALRDVLIHECAHLVQNHHVLGCAQRWVAILFWPHPLVHALCRELGQSAEELCDNFVLRHSEAPQYARTLLAVATTRSSVVRAEAPTVRSAAPPSVPRWRGTVLTRRPRSGGLSARVERLLDRKRERRTQWDLWKQVVLTSLFLAVATSVSAMRVSQAAARIDPAVRVPAPTSPQQKVERARRLHPSSLPASRRTGSPVRREVRSR